MARLRALIRSGRLLYTLAASLAEFSGRVGYKGRKFLWSAPSFHVRPWTVFHIIKVRRVADCRSVAWQRTVSLRGEVLKENLQLVGFLEWKTDLSSSENLCAVSRKGGRWARKISGVVVSASCFCCSSEVTLCWVARLEPRGGKLSVDRSDRSYIMLCTYQRVVRMSYTSCPLWLLFYWTSDYPLKLANYRKAICTGMPGSGIQCYATPVLFWWSLRSVAISVCVHVSWQNFAVWIRKLQHKNNTRPICIYHCCANNKKEEA